MKATLFLLGALLSVGCGAPWPETPYRYEAGCLAFDSERELDGAAIASNAAAVQEALAGIVPPERFCEAFGGLPLLIRAAPSFDSPGDGAAVDGWTDGHQVQIGASMRALPHELLHVWAFQTAGRLDHDDWEADGYWDAIGLYIRKRVFPYSPFSDLD